MYAATTIIVDNNEVEVRTTEKFTRGHVAVIITERSVEGSQTVSVLVSPDQQKRIGQALIDAGKALMSQ